MDPVTHAVMARMLTPVRAEHISPRIALLAVVAGLAPDVDAVVMPAGWDLYLRVHEVGTHSLSGALVLAGVLAAASRPFIGGPFRRLFAVALAGVASHVLLDVLSGASIRLAWPFATWRTTVGLIGMADPWLAVPVALALVLVLVTRLRIDAVAPYVLAFAAVLFAGKAVSRQAALRHYRAVADPAAMARSVQAEWGSLTRWWVYERTTGRVRGWTVDAKTGVAAITLDMPAGTARPMSRGEDQLAPVTNALSLLELPVRITTFAGDKTTVFWSDLRFCYTPDATAGPLPGSRLRPTADPIACGVWFAGEIDPQGRVVRQFVTIGEYLQAR